jgi:4-amino-4-deoxy-L-arabinose transferase-like glycosyltransferase
LAFLYFYGLGKTGVLSSDEPRYAAIGREMAHSGDWVTPRLWGSPWFEKPPLLYWTTAVATLAGLGPELAPRLPVALIGFGFLLFFYWWVRDEFGSSEALYATAMLGTSAGWLAYSYVAVTDIPLSACFCAALLLAMRIERRGPATAAAAGAMLGLAMLAKGLVPLVLFLPVIVLLRRRFRDLLIVALVTAIVAGPWYLLCTWRNGHAFIDEFIWKHHFARFTSGALLHVRPFWFYIPVLLGLLFPWTPVLAAFRLRITIEPRLRFLALWAAFAFVFFSASHNKLPGYMLPLLPVICIIVGIALAWARRTWVPLAAAGLLVSAVPLAMGVVPQALVTGLSRSKLPPAGWIWPLAGIACAALCVFFELRNRRSDAVTLVAVALAITFLQAKLTTLPILDRTVSARVFYDKHAQWLEDACLQDVSRDQAYGLAYYLGRELPVCTDPTHKPKVMGVGGQLILLD